MIKHRRLFVSIVLYKTNIEQVVRCINCVNKSIEATIFLIDNSPTNELQTVEEIFQNVQYIVNPSNPGYGAAHNIALKNAMESKSNYHLVLNADVYFPSSTLGTLIEYMDARNDVGLVMPKIFFPNGEVQYLCKLIPTPKDLILRMIAPKKIQRINNFKFEMRSTNYSKEMFVPYLSGCFMFLRVDALVKCGIFDERFFMYPEDIDLTRRIAAHYKTMFYPAATAFHEYGAASKKSITMLFVHIHNIVKYFNKWGWFFDSERQRLNKLAKNQR